MSDLVFAKDLSLPIDAVTQKFAFLGRSSSGKTYAAKRLVESLLDSGAQVIVIDPVGIWHGLREHQQQHLADKRKTYPIPVLGGFHGDLPLTGTAGAVVARVVVERGTSVVLDVSQMHDAERTRFATAFAQTFFEMKKAAPSAVHLVMEEAQELLPQNPQPGEQLMLHEFQRIAKIGRNFGIGLSLVSQRPQEVSKKALNQTECVLAFQMTGPQERKALEYWLSDRGIEQSNLGKLLPSLAVGQPWLWSPSWLKMNEVIEILPISTSDTGKTPEPGAPPPLASLRAMIDIDSLQKELTEAVEQATSDDPKLLKKRITELEGKLKAQGGVFDQNAFLRQVDPLVVHQQNMLANLDRATGELQEVLKQAHNIKNQTQTLLAWGKSQASLTLAIAPAGGKVRRTDRRVATEPAGGKVRQTTHQPTPPRDKVGALAMGESSVLRVLVAAGDKGCTKAQVLLQTGYKKSSVRLYIGRLITAKLAEQAAGIAWATPAGVKLCPDVGPLPKGKKLVQHIIETLPSGERKVLACVYDAHVGRETKSRSKEELAQLTGFASSSVRLYIGRLVTRNLVVNKKGHVSLHPELHL